MASVLVLARFPKDRVKRFDRLVKGGEALSRSDAVRMLTELGYREYLRERSLEAIRETAGIIKETKETKGKSSVQIIREARDERWQKFLKKAGGNREKAAQLLVETANRANIRFRKAALP